MNGVPLSPSESPQEFSTLHLDALFPSCKNKDFKIQVNEDYIFYLLQLATKTEAIQNSFNSNEWA